LAGLAVALISYGNARTMAERLDSGQRTFLSSCAMCHGTGGAGDGPLAEALAKEGGAIPARLNDAARLAQLGRAGVHRVIVNGGGHTSRSNLMPAWGERLEPKLADDVTDFVMSLPQRSPGVPPATLEKYLKAPPGVAAEGRNLFVYYCSGCHGMQGRGDGTYARELRSRHKVWPRNLTQTSYFKTRTDQDLYVAVALGGTHKSKMTFMPAWTVTLTPEQIKHLVAYVRVLSGTPSRP
jgi:mono/diheme cytochrome c family protein